MKNFLIIVVGVLILNALFLYSGAFDYLKNWIAAEEPASVIKTDVNEVFKETLEKEVIEKLGQPIEGFEPYMFMEVFPGLTATDFANVKASMGKYIVVDGQLQHELGDEGLVHSAAGAITRNGMATLLSNVSNRLGIDLSNGGTLTDVMNAIVAE